MAYDEVTEVRAEAAWAAKDRDVPNLEAQLNAVDQGLARLDDVLTRARSQLAPLARPEASGEALKNADVPEQMLSSTAGRVRNHARQANRLANDFIELLDCLDV